MQKKKKFPWQQCVVMLLYMLVGAVCGLAMVGYMDASAEEAAGAEWFRFALMVLAVCVAVYVQLIVHEAGHLLFGLWTGYRFSSFRIGSLMLIKDGEKLRFKRLSLAGTGGQCLMDPPDMQDGRIPFVLYNFGGAFLNIFCGVLCFIGYFLCGKTTLAAVFFLMCAVLGAVFAVTNGVPMRLGTVDNDGYNALSLGKNKAALRAFWVQMKTNEQLSKGLRLKEMPAEWFEVPQDDEMQNSMVAALGVFACNRLMDERRFAEADALMAHLLQIDTAIVGLHRNLLICDRMYCALVHENRAEALQEMYTAEQKKFMKAMKNFPTVIRTEYAIALLAEQNTAKAEALRTQFEKCAKTYPYVADIQSERELMQLAETCVVKTCE